jgi:hypothetical protein
MKFEQWLCVEEQFFTPAISIQTILVDDLVTKFCTQDFKFEIV